MGGGVGGHIHITRAITADGTFKVPKTGKPRSVLLMPPAAEACKNLMALVAGDTPRSLEVYMNCYESRIETVTPLLSPTTQARKKTSTGGSFPRPGTLSGQPSKNVLEFAHGAPIKRATPTHAGAFLQMEILLLLQSRWGTKTLRCSLRSMPNGWTKSLLGS